MLAVDRAGSVEVREKAALITTPPVKHINSALDARDMQLQQLVCFYYSDVVGRWIIHSSARHRLLPPLRAIITATSCCGQINLTTINVFLAVTMSESQLDDRWTTGGHVDAAPGRPPGRSCSPTLKPPLDNDMAKSRRLLRDFTVSATNQWTIATAALR